jgi:hypothetical protein
MAETKRKVVEKTKVGESIKDNTADESVTESSSSLFSGTPVSLEQQAQSQGLFVQLNDGVFVDLTQIQGHALKHEGKGTVFLKGGNSFDTPCGDELVSRLKQDSSYQCVFVQLNDGVFVDLMEVQGYTHEKDNVGRVFLKGGNNFETPCGDELVSKLRRHRFYD